MTTIEKIEALRSTYNAMGANELLDQVIEILKAQKTISCKALRKRGTDDIWVYNPGDIKSFKDMEQIDITIIVEE
jgi:hypothetical protein